MEIGVAYREKMSQWRHFGDILETFGDILETFYFLANPAIVLIISGSNDPPAENLY